MKISMLQRLLSEQDPDAEVMVSVDMMLSRSEPRPGTLSLPTRALDAGTFQSGDMVGRSWVAIIACEAWGQSPSVGLRHTNLNECASCGEVRARRQEIMMLKGYSPEGERTNYPHVTDARDVAFDEIRHTRKR